MEVVVGFVGNVDGGAGVWYGLFLGLLVEYGGLPGELWSSMVWFVKWIVVVLVGSRGKRWETYFLFNIILLCNYIILISCM